MRVVFIGTGEIGVPTLRWLRETDQHELVGVVTQPDKPVGREQKLQAPPIKAALADSPIPVLQPARIKHAEAVAQIAALSADVIVVMAYGQILPRAVLELPRLACLNLHASLLPKYRGAAPIQAAILAGNAETGLTVMYMDEGLDTGDMLLTSRIAIAPNETGGSLHDRLAEIAPAALSEALQQIENGDVARVPQDSAQASYAPKLEREDGELDWQESAAAIERKIRAFDPWPGTYTSVSDASGQRRKLKIFGAKIAAANGSAAGQIVADGSGFAIAASDGLVRPREVQLEGKKRMTSADFVRGHPWIAQARVTLG